MASEVSIAKALSGSESLTSIMDSIRKHLERDDRFSDNMAYTGFHAVIDVKFYPQHSFIPPVDRMIVVDEGDQSDISETATVNELIDLPILPPNEVRENADLPTPVLVTDAKGLTHEKWVKRGKSPIGRTSLPKNRTND
jgi:hypothetical protein